jgi:hypothetical protein
MLFNDDWSVVHINRYRIDMAADALALMRKGNKKGKGHKEEDDVAAEINNKEIGSRSTKEVPFYKLES